MNDTGSVVLDGIPCDACAGKGCPDCLFTTHKVIRGCPQSHVTRDVWDAIQAANFARRGSWPNGGGTLDQTVCFLTACDLIWSEENAVRAELQLDPL